MSNLSLFSNPALQSQNGNANKFNLVPQSSPFNAVFNTKPLPDSDASILETLIVTNAREEAVVQNQIEQDVDHLKQITAEIKSIGQQGAILIGERIYKAGKILKSYRDGTFTKWLEFALGSKKTGYNMLAYYELYKELPNETVKETYKRIPQKAAYILASKEGSLEKKLEIINGSQNLKTEELISRIREEFPSQSPKQRASLYLKDIRSLKEISSRLFSNRELLSDNEKEDILEAIDLLERSVRSL